MRKSLESLNSYQELDLTNRIFKLFVHHKIKLITPSYFLVVIFSYLRNIKNKKQMLLLFLIFYVFYLLE